MAIDFKGKDVIHKIAVKFVHAFLPEAKKPFYLKTVHQPELDIHGIASKAELYNVAVPPKVIVDGFNAAMELIYYLAADGFKIKTPLFTICIRVLGEYDGSETRLPDGVFPQACIQVSLEFRNFIKEKVKVEFDGFLDSDGLIAEAVDEASGFSDELMTIGNILTIRGYGLKIEADEVKKAEAGLFFVSEKGDRIKASAIAVNEPRTLKVVVPQSLTEGEPYAIEIFTQSSARTGGHIVKEMRSMKSEFTVTVQ